MRELGRVAARYFDEVIVREDVNPRGRERGETGSLVMEGIDEARAQGARVGHAEIVTDELEACRSALDRSRPGDLVVLCVDRAAEVWDEIESRRSAVRSLSVSAGLGATSVAAPSRGRHGSRPARPRAARTSRVAARAR